MILGVIIDEHLPSFLDALLDYTGDDAGFIQLVKTRSAEIVCKVIEEIEDGFTDGFTDVLDFFKATATNLLMASAPPQ